MTAADTLPHPTPADAREGVMIDQHGRRIDYVRISVTDRCNLRCTYCMPETMRFLPRRDLLELDEIARIAALLVRRGVRHIRITGGEPLVRSGVVDLIARIGALREAGLREVTLTTNGTRLAHHARDLAAGGVRRVNVSLDTLDRATFAAIARRDDFDTVIAGIDAARAAGLAVKINMVAQAGVNADEIPAMIDFCGARGMDLTLIETMPMGVVDGGREATHLPLDTVREKLARDYTLTPSGHRTAGPSRYWRIAQTGMRIGFITPLSDNFCATCNRIRIAANGMVYGCLGHDRSVDLRAAIRRPDHANGRDDALTAAIDAILAAKPLRHDFTIDDSAPPATRTMNMTGG